MQIMFQQLRPGNSYARISWQDLFAAMKVYCERFSPGPEQQVSTLKHTHHAPCRKFFAGTAAAHLLRGPNQQALVMQSLALISSVGPICMAWTDMPVPTTLLSSTKSMLCAQPGGRPDAAVPAQTHRRRGSQQ